MSQTNQQEQPAAGAQRSPAPVPESLVFSGPWMPDEEAWDKVREAALRSLDRMMGLEPKVLRGEKPGAIHDFRVASRRLQQALDLLCPPEPSHRILRLRRSVARSRKTLSEVRNHDVFIRRIGRILATKRPARREAWQSVADYLQKQRKKTRARAAAKVAKLKLSRVYVRLRTLLEPEAFFAGKSPGAARSKAWESLGEGDFRERLATEVQNVWEAFEEASARARDASEATTVHSLRLAVKRLRYLMEIIHEFEAVHSGRALKLLQIMQDFLGDWHDLEVAEQMMSRLAARPKFVRKHLRLAGEVLKLIAQNRKAKERLRASHSSNFHSGASEELHSCLASILGGKSGDP